MNRKNRKMENENPVVYEVRRNAALESSWKSLDFSDELEREPFDADEVFELIRNINDPEHPLTLEQLKVVESRLISVNEDMSTILVRFTPTIPHCSMATLIGLSIRVKLLRSLPSRFKVVVEITPGTHQSEAAINRQLNDKERVAAALENAHLLDVVNKCIATSY